MKRFTASCLSKFNAPHCVEMVAGCSDGATADTAATDDSDKFVVSDDDVVGESAQVKLPQVPFDWASFVALGKSKCEERDALRGDGTYKSRLEKRIEALGQKSDGNSSGGKQSLAQPSRKAILEVQNKCFLEVMEMCDAGRKWYATLRDKARALPPAKRTFHGIFGDDGFDAFAEHGRAAGLDGPPSAEELWDYGATQLQKLARPLPGDLPVECLQESFRHRCIAELRRGGTGLVEPAHAYDEVALGTP
jgi:hypothetical protein